MIERRHEHGFNALMNVSVEERWVLRSVLVHQAVLNDVRMRHFNP
jgi:hypothetical protein